MKTITIKAGSEVDFGTGFSKLLTDLKVECTVWTEFRNEKTKCAELDNVDQAVEKAQEDLTQGG